MMHEARFYRRPMRARRGTSLVMVLVVAVAGMVLLGTAFYMQGLFASRSVSSVENMEEENFMDAAIEKGKLLLFSKIKSSDFAPSYPTRNTDVYIKKIDDLIARENNGKGNELKFSDEMKSAAGDKLVVDVKVYDLQYVSADLDNDNITKENRYKLPPSLISTDDEYHMYLIRATMKRPSHGGVTVATEVAIKTRIDI